MSPCSHSSNEDWLPPAESSLSTRSHRSALKDKPWSFSEHVLSTGSFPSTSILRRPKKKDGQRMNFGSCTCSENEHHRSLFDLCRTVIGPHLNDPKSRLEGVKVCWNAENIWESLIPREMSGLSKRVPFEKLGTVYRAQMVLFKGTYWFRRLIPSGNSNGQKHSRNGLAMLRLLAGYRTFSGPEHIGQLVRKPLNVNSVQKLRNMLAVVDGMLMQIVLCFPGDKEVLTWPVMDRITHSLICGLLPDYFREERDVRTSLTTFEKVKKIRKGIKEQGFNPVGRFESVEVPQELSFFRFLLKRLGDEKSPLGAYRTLTLAQTRASGVPPRAVYFKTLEKIKKILQEPSSEEEFNSFRPYIGPAIDEVYHTTLETLGGNENRDRFFTRCVSAAKVSLSDSGEFFSKAKDGGKLEAARLVLRENPEVEEINLDTGQKTGRKLTIKDGQGNMLFHWACGQFLDRRNVYNRNVMSVRISLVAELGKYRSITVSHLAHAVLLHVLSHVLLEFLRVIPSSESGVGAANHAWNFFKRISTKNPSSQFLFMQDVFMFSTDWEQATDLCNQKIAGALLNKLCVCFGVPVWYRQTCTFALTAPRQVEFLDPEDKSLGCFFTSRGVLMGDPVTKVILHTYHLVCRNAVKRLLRLSRRNGLSP
ncbi:RNA-dependent RNA polymerase [Suillus luteus narnavirus 4]|uniref:RNA-dependent RNA polymerase n=1 Tax=Suillus luteus narnavirus 4 TaxID=3067823 RepID=A0AA49X744_9VIRU|nr:RNA-dependent RNA polymerase [Suillus luteus narnavirus 4]